MIPMISDNAIINPEARPMIVACNRNANMPRGWKGPAADTQGTVDRR
jgi:hypothetical protein